MRYTPHLIVVYLSQTIGQNFLGYQPQNLKCNAGFPIDLISSLRINTMQDDFAFEGYELPAPGEFNGVAFLFDISQPITVTGGVLATAMYTIYAIRLVWGEESSDGSWHNIDGRKYDAEFQIFLIEKSTNIDVVLSFLFEESPVENSNIQPFIEHLVNGDTEAQITMSTLVPKESYYGNYYYYTDSCYNITFITFENTLSISENQLNNLRSLNLQGTEPPIQPLGDTVIYYRNTPSTSTSSTTITSTTEVSVASTYQPIQSPTIIDLFLFSLAVVLITNAIEIVATSLVPGFLGFDEFGNSITISDPRRSFS